MTKEVHDFNNDANLEGIWYDLIIGRDLFSKLKIAHSSNKRRNASYISQIIREQRLWTLIIKSKCRRSCRDCDIFK